MPMFESAFALRPVLFRTLDAPTSGASHCSWIIITGTMPATQHNLICVISAIGPSALSAIASPPRPPQPPAPVGHASGQLVDDEVTDLTDIPAIGSIDRGSVDVFARNASMVWMSSCACHGVPPCNGLLPFQFDHGGGASQTIPHIITPASR